MKFIASVQLEKHVSTNVLVLSDTSNVETIKNNLILRSGVLLVDRIEPLEETVGYDIDSLPVYDFREHFGDPINYPTGT
jgi:hypothetical protein